MSEDKPLEMPQTIDEAVLKLVKLLGLEQCKKVAAMREDELIGQLHNTLGQWIRNNFGLWKGNETLKKATGKEHPDDASSVIVVALWKMVSESGAATIISEETSDES